MMMNMQWLTYFLYCLALFQQTETLTRTEVLKKFSFLWDLMQIVQHWLLYDQLDVI